MSLNKKTLIEELKKGYEEMAEINAALAEEGVAADNEALERCEEKLTECD
ncbi:MAG: hypothetical protein LUD03_06055 [Firmicutes bacterium]|nr:hypothetical protein [Bacillota bacterium]